MDADGQLYEEGTQEDRDAGLPSPHTEGRRLSSSSQNKLLLVTIVQGRGGPNARRPARWHAVLSTRRLLQPAWQVLELIKMQHVALAYFGYQTMKAVHYSRKQKELSPRTDE